MAMGRSGYPKHRPFFFCLSETGGLKGDSYPNYQYVSEQQAHFKDRCFIILPGTAEKH